MFCYTYHREVDSVLFVVGPFKTEKAAHKDAADNNLTTLVRVRPMVPAKKIVRKPKAPANTVG